MIIPIRCFTCGKVRIFLITYKRFVLIYGMILLKAYKTEQKLGNKKLINI